MQRSDLFFLSRTETSDDLTLGCDAQDIKTQISSQRKQTSLNLYHFHFFTQLLENNKTLLVKQNLWSCFLVVEVEKHPCPKTYCISLLSYSLNVETNPLTLREAGFGGPPPAQLLQLCISVLHHHGQPTPLPMPLMLMLSSWEYKTLRRRDFRCAVLLSALTIFTKTVQRCPSPTYCHLTS